jgi:glucose-6-phosphate 1-dehydrogenase
MSDTRPVVSSPPAETDDTNPPTEPCIMLLFGASGDLTKRLLVPALYNLACDGLLSDNFALIGSRASRPRRSASG